MSTVRVVRPRPLGVNDRIPVFWAGQDPPQELKNIDGGALYRHINAADTPTTNRKRKRGERYHAPKEGEAIDHLSPLRRAHQQQQQGPGSPIAVPRVREVPDYELNQQAAVHHGPMVQGDINAAPYLRHKELLPGMYDDHHQAEYDADDEDMAFIAGINNPKSNQSLFAAAMGLCQQVAQRISRSDSGVQPATPSAAVDRLPLVDFERAMDLLEKLHLEAVQEWWQEQQSAGVGHHVPRVPSMKHLLPRSEALAALAGLLPDKKVATQVLEYWLRRRQQEGGPLLSRMWFEQPWKLVAFAQFVDSDDEDFDEHLPFMAVEPRSAHKNRRGGQNRRRLNDEDALEALYTLRNELEVVRTLADQVRKREKLKRQLLVVWQQEWQMRRQLGILPGEGRSTRRSMLAAVSEFQAARAAEAAAAAAVAAVSSSPQGAGGPLAAVQVAAGAAEAGRPTGARVRAVTGGSRRRRQMSAEVSKELAAAAAAAAAAASPEDAGHARQTRTAAAAAAAAFELAFVAKRRRLLGEVAAADHVASEGAIGEASKQPPQQSGDGDAAKAAAVVAPPARRRGRPKGSGRGSKKAVSRPRMQHSKKQQQQQQPVDAAAAGDADDELELSSGQGGSPVTTEVQLDEDENEQQEDSDADAQPANHDARHHHVHHHHQQQQQRPKQVRPRGTSARQQRQQDKKQEQLEQELQGSKAGAGARNRQVLAATAAVRHRAWPGPAHSDDSEDEDYIAPVASAELKQRKRPRLRARPLAAAGSSSGQSSSELEDAAAEAGPLEPKAAWKEAEDDEAEGHNQHTDDDEFDEDFEPAGSRPARRWPVKKQQQKRPHKQQQPQQQRKQQTSARVGPDATAVAVATGARGAGGRRLRQQGVQQEQQQQQPQQQRPLRQQLALHTSANLKQQQTMKRNGYVRKPPVLIQLQVAAEAAAQSNSSADGSGHDSDSGSGPPENFVKGPRTPRKHPHSAVGGGSAANAGAGPTTHQRWKQQPQQRVQQAARRADATSVHHPSEVRVLKPHNRQSKQPHRAGSKEAAYVQQKLGSQQAGSKAVCASTVAGRAVAAPGAAVRPQSGRLGNGGRQVVGASSKHRFSHPRGIGAAELRSLGIVSNAGNDLEAAGRSSKRR